MPKQSKYSVDDREFRLTVTNIRYKNDKVIIEFSGRENLICYYYDDFNYSLGDKLKITGSLKEANNNTIPNLFNYKRYLYYNDIHYILMIEKIELLQRNNNLIYKIKNFLIKRIEKINVNREYLYAFLLGETYYIDQEIKEAYQFNGVSHLLAIGSSSITLITCMVTYLFHKMKMNDYLYLSLMIGLIVIYIILTNYSVSIIRCGLAFILTYINKKWKLNIKYQNIIILITSLSLLYNPYYIYNLGFQYSYLISFVLVIYNSLIKGNCITKLLKVSMIAYLVSFPINIYNNYEINFLSIILNLLYVPLVNFIIFPLSLMVVLFPFINGILEIVINITEKITAFFGNIRFFSLVMAKPSWLVIIIYYLIIFYVLNGFKKKRWFRFLILVLMVFIHYNINNIRKEDYLLMLDVRQGDAIILKSDNKVVLMDTGGSYNYHYSNDIIDYLKSKGINKINYLLITHGDFDHMGEAINMVNNFKVEKVIFNNGDYNELESKLIKVLNKKKIKYYKGLSKLKVNKYKLYFLNTKIYDNENDNSNVIYFNYDNFKFLFMGDAGVDKEMDILDKYSIHDIDFLKVGHHGSNTSSGKEFINSIKPKYSLISVGKNNRYGHPKKVVLDTLSNTKIYRTDVDGSVEIKLKRSGYEISTCAP